MKILKISVKLHGKEPPTIRVEGLDDAGNYIQHWTTLEAGVKPTTEVHDAVKELQAFASLVSEEEPA